MGKLGEIKGDSLSKLLQVRAALKGVHLKWTGDALQDIDQLCLEYYHRKNLNECLWNGMRELMDMPALKELPEPVYAQILSIVLRAQANFEVRRAEEQGKNPQHHPASLTPTPTPRLPGPA
jgi:hypothetical protein